jgi:hypothetical protein
VISTAVDGIPDYITHKENGLLITETEEEKIIPRESNFLKLLINDHDLKKSNWIKSYQYAIKHSAGKLFANHTGKIFTRVTNKEKIYYYSLLYRLNNPLPTKELSSCFAIRIRIYP